jgi:hypothetical protein
LYNYDGCTARTLSNLGSRAVIITDDCCAPALVAILEAMRLEEPGGAERCSRITIETFAGGDKWGDVEEARLDAIAGSIDHCLTIERSG